MVLDQAATSALRTEVGGEHRYLLLLSHMRSYSSLLAHVLGSSPEVNGYGETLLRYKLPLDLWRLRREIRRSTGRPLRGPWLLDKVLHNTIKPLDRWVERDRLRALIFLRQPEPTLRSVLTLAQADDPRSAMRDPQKCCDYYVSRLHRLREDGERLGGGALYLDAAALIQRPHAVLGAVGSWLGLHEPLAPSYEVGSRSGEVGFGDPSRNIRAGRILAAEATTVRPDLRLPADIVAEAEAAYRRCRTTLLQHCASRPDLLV